MGEVAKPNQTFQRDRSPVSCLLGLGSNLGDRQRTLEQAIARLDQDTASQVIAVSRLISSRPIGGPANQSSFLNAAVTLTTTRSPHDLLRFVQSIEAQLGRQRGEPWSARTLDIDLLMYGRHVLRDAILEVPHPWMVARQFVLEPAAEIAGAWQHPLLGWTLDQLWRHARTASPNYCLVGDVDTSTFAELASDLGAKWIANPLQAIEETTGIKDPTPFEDAQYDTAGGSSVPKLESWIECLRQARVALTRAGWNEEREQPILLSEFWYPDLVHRLLERATVDASHPLLQRELPEARSIAPAKLIIVMAPKHPTAKDCKVDATEATWSEQELVRSKVSPFIVIRASRRKDQARLMLGAIQAMENR